MQGKPGKVESNSQELSKLMNRLSFTAIAVTPVPLDYLNF